MIFDIQISFAEDFITVRKGDATRRFSNLMAINDETGKIIEVGQTEDEIASYNLQKWTEEKQKISFKPIYMHGKLDLDDMHLAVWALVTQFSENGTQFKKLSCNVEIPGYELLQKDLKAHFEYSVQSLLRFKNLSINSNQSLLNGNKLVIARITLELGRWIGFALALYLSYVNLDILVDIFGFFYLILLIVSIGVGIWATEVLWLVFMQTALPKKFIRLIFQEGYGSGRFSISKTLAKLILGDV